MRERRPSEVLRLLNETLRREDVGDRFVTAALCALDRVGDGFRATIASAGHVPAVVRAAGEVRTLDHVGSLLGVFDEIGVDDIELELAPGDALLLCTDGVTEARGGSRRQLGLERVAEAALHGPDGAQALAEAIGTLVIDHAGPVAQDDVAILALRVAS